MATATAQQQQHQTLTSDEAYGLLEQVLQNTAPVERGKQVQELLLQHISTLEAVLPESFKGQAERFVKRFMLTYQRSPHLHDCTPISLFRSVLDAAELGLAIDGKLGYAVPYNNKKKVNGREVWFKEAQFQPDYKGLIVIAKRTGQIIDVEADVVYSNDHYKAARSGDKSILEHQRASLGEDRGHPVGAYARIWRASGWRFEQMDIKEVNAIRKRSKASGSGPWVTDEDEMIKKTVIRRGLKTYCDDPGMQKALDMLDREYDFDPEEYAARFAFTEKRVTTSSLNDLLDSRNDTPAATSSATQSTPKAKRQPRRQERQPEPAAEVEESGSEFFMPEPGDSPDDIPFGNEEAEPEQANDSGSPELYMTFLESLEMKESLDEVADLMQEAMAKRSQFRPDDYDSLLKKCNAKITAAKKRR